MTVLTTVASLAVWVALLLLSPTALVIVALLGSLVINR